MIEFDALLFCGVNSSVFHDEINRTGINQVITQAIYESAKITLR